MIHEAVTPILDSFRKSNTGLGGYFRYIWVVPYVVAFVGLALYCAPFLWQLPARIRNLFVLSGCVFVTGAAGLELIEGHFDTVYGYNSVYKIVLYTTEEVMEMGGVILFIYALLLYIATTTGRVQLNVSRAAQTEPGEKLSRVSVSNWATIIPANNTLRSSEEKRGKLSISTDKTVHIVE